MRQIAVPLVFALVLGAVPTSAEKTAKRLVIPASVFEMGLAQQQQQQTSAQTRRIGTRTWVAIALIGAAAVAVAVAISSQGEERRGDVHGGG